MTNKQSATDLRSLKVESSSRIGRTIGTESATGRSAEKVDGIREPKEETRGTVGSAAGSPRDSLRRTIGRPEGRDNRTGAERTQTDISRQSEDIGTREQSVSPLGESSRPFRRTAPQEQTTTINNPSIDSVRTDSTRLHSYETFRPSRVVYYDRPNLIGSSYHHDYAYRDYHDRICTWSVWPRFRFALYYNCGPWSSFRYVYPYYLRKYMFISLGGYWPLDYRYTRYYWYGCHPYNWYGYYPIAREVPDTTYNYYTYNYYTNDDGSYQPAQTVNPEIFENITEQTTEPQEATLADIYFEEAVKAFEVAQYDTAAMKFAQAMELAPEDMILPFAYSQALIGSEQYSKAAEVLRGALEKVSPEKEGVFFPRGLYPDEDSLLKQIDKLTEQAAQFSFDADLQLLLGYQLLGIGQHDRAVEPLMNAGKDLKNAKAAGVLMELLEKIKSAESKPETSAPAQTPAPETPAPPVPAPETPSPLQSPAPTPDKAVVPSSEPAPKLSEASIINHSRALGGAMLVTSLCALGASFGIKHFVHV
jgi:tetratricopeptide (TPR) repeat protein